jgi:hypothetical protein
MIVKKLVTFRDCPDISVSSKNHISKYPIYPRNHESAEKGYELQKSDK